MTGQISSSLLFFILCWSQNMTTGAWVAVWNCSTDTIFSHYTIARYTHTSTFQHVSSTNRQHQADVKTQEYLLLTFYGTRRFITAFTSARQLPLSWARLIQSIHLHPTSWRSILKLSSHLRLGLPSGFFPSGFTTKTLNTPLFFPYMLHALSI